MVVLFTLAGAICVYNWYTKPCSQPHSTRLLPLVPAGVERTCSRTTCADIRYMAPALSFSAPALATIRHCTGERTVRKKLEPEHGEHEHGAEQ